MSRMTGKLSFLRRPSRKMPVAVNVVLDEATQAKGRVGGEIGPAKVEMLWRTVDRYGSAPRMPHLDHPPRPAGASQYP